VAVVFFDNWIVMDDLFQELPLVSFPTADSDVFVFFDDRHCRGADMRLRVSLRPSNQTATIYLPPHGASYSYSPIHTFNVLH